MKDRSSLIPMVAALSEARVLCVGDVMLDHFISGEVERISPEAPIPVLSIAEESTMLGGAGNVVRNLVSLGADARFVTVVGNDQAGDDVAGQFNSLGLDHSPIVDGGRRTSTKTRFLAGNQQMMRADWESTAPLARKVADKVCGTAKAGLADSGAVALSDYGKGVLSDQVLADLIGAARAAGKPVVVDPKGTDFGRYKGADLVTPNRRELAEATAMAVGSNDEIVAAARHLIETCEIGAVLATRGGGGMTLLTRDGDVHHLASEAREVFDVSGAGDTVVACMAAAASLDIALADAAAIANTAAGVVVGKVGTAAARGSEVIAALHHQDISTAEAKVLTMEQAAERIALWRRQDIKVGFTNGVFDLLHPGHVSLLGQARDASDRLVVGLNSDASVKRLKGDDRPVQTEAARAAVLACLEPVDVVVIFSEDTPQRLIETLKPDILVKGADYALSEVVGAELVEAYGGTVLLAELEPGHSTTATIARMAKEGA